MNPAIPPARVGLVFRHMRFLTPTATARDPEYQVYRVTAIRRGVVYYGQGEEATRASFHRSLEAFPEIVREIITPLADG